MRIYFSRYQEQSRKYVIGFWVAFLVGAVAILTANPTGFGLGALLLAVCFVALCGYMAAKVGDDYRDQDFRSRELSGDEYMALDSRLQTYPELKSQVAESLSDSRRITYAQAYELEDLVNAHADEVTATEDKEAQQKNRQALFENVGKG
jgi:predicted metal-binding transcription factor (methanogenesis marker protein 9)